jgi:antitoxin component YwqK of YwqJK toxin-antitoxin module
MKQLGILGCIFILITCSRNSNSTILFPTELKVVNYDTSLKKSDSGWFYKSQLFSGYMVETEKGGLVVYQLPIINGKENGLAKGIYNSGEKLLERNFVDGKREGLFKQWWPNGNLRYLFSYKNDKYEGAQYIFFPDGKRQQVGNYVNGVEEGLQSSWDTKGQLVSNYTIRNNKLYGVISVKSCMPDAH